MQCRLPRAHLRGLLAPTPKSHLLPRPKPYPNRPAPLPSRLFATTTTKMAPTPPADPRPLVISGPSGVGKGTLISKLFAAHPESFALSVSHTTRAPRPGEQHGVHYFFVSPADFAALVAADGFVEHAQFGSNRYGTSKATVAEQAAKGRVTVLDIEMEGVKQIKTSGLGCRFVFIAPPSFEALERRLRGRGTETDEAVEKRLKQAKVELEYANSPDAPHDIVIVNDDLETAYKTLEDYVFGRSTENKAKDS